ncbi:benzoate membrane transport protein [Haloactinomyces albus]|uniref:Benzoate membrane transport protein n=2 Tax=Haloactinomyces albus TaxID=1352928 RepID=A0AAE3ZIQ1_9ACTN|nr:benzoate/H(+) symporter BenE family transporter [Haloactinomyces albus]MDR7304328.1 benzoate membrane transport protein [Haloactinomyces albus]
MARDFGARYFANGLVGLIFAATGPVAVILAVGSQGGLAQAQLASWIFGVFFINGILTVLACWFYQQPLSFFWTIPGTVLVGPALDHLSWPEVVGAFLATGVLILLLGLSGWVRRVMSAIPMPIVMGMVAGVFLSFGLDLVHALVGDIAIAGPMVLLFLLLSWHSSLGRRIPPIIGALLIGGVAVAMSGRFAPETTTVQWIASPMVQTPQWSWQAMLELVIPLAITVLVVQNGQGTAVLRSAGHPAPVNMVAIACGAWSVLTSFVGSVSTCLTGPTNALLTASGERSRHYIAGISCGLLAIVFGLFAPLFTDLMLATPGAFIATLGGLAMLRVLQSSFVTAFSTRFTFGALITFVVTVADVEIMNIGSAFWGLIAGIAVSWLLERSDFAASEEARS